MVVDAMRAIAVGVEDAGGIVGHVKAFGKSQAGFAHASVTAAGFDPTFEGDQSLSLDHESDAQLVAIALLVDLEVLQDIVQRSLQNRL